MKYLFWIGAAVAAVAAGVIGYQYELHQIPVREMEKAETGIAARAQGFNNMIHPPRPSAASRTVVRPSPDQLYSACSYDLSDGPVVFKGRAPTDSYWSLSFFAHNSDNFFVVNDRQLDQPDFRYVLLQEGAKVPAGVSESQVVRSPSKTGIVLQRIFIDQEGHATALDDTRKQTTCSVMES